MYLSSTSTELKVHDCSDYSQKFSFGSYENSIKLIEWSASGKYILQVNPNGRLEVLSVTEDGVRSLQYVPSTESSIGTFESGNHREIGVGCTSGNVFIWNTKNKSVVKNFSSTFSPVKLLSFNTKNTYLAASLENGNTVVYGMNTNNQVASIKVPSSKNISVLAFHNEYSSILGLATEDGSILLRDMGMGKNKMFSRDAHTSVVSGIAYSPVNKEVMLSCGFDKKMNLHDTRIQTIGATIQTEYALTSIDMKDATVLALGNRKGEILIYDLRNFSSPLESFADHQSSVLNVKFQPILSKNKKYLIPDVSPSESSFSKMISSPRTPPLVKSPESSKSFNFSNLLYSPVAESAPLIKETDNSSKTVDSFLVNILGESNNASSNKNIDNQYKASPINASRNQLLLNLSNKASPADTSNGNFESPPCFTTFSTPIIGKISNTDYAYPSPDDKHVDISPSNASKKIHSPDSISVIETIKNVNNNNTELGIEFYDALKYSMHEVTEGCRRNYINMTVENVKTRIYFEDQISAMVKKMDELLQNQNTLIEQNKKLMIEMEIIRSQQK